MFENIIAICAIVYAWVGLYLLSKSEYGVMVSDGERIVTGLLLVFFWPVHLLLKYFKSWHHRHQI